MARVKISEYKAKQLLLNFLDISFTGTAAQNSDTVINSLDPQKKYVIKVDQGVKKRFKRGLMGVDKTVDEVKEEIERLKNLGYEHFIIEEFREYKSDEEQYISLERVRDGFRLLYSNKGGVSVEEQGNMQEYIVLSNDEQDIPYKSFVKQLISFMDSHYISFLEINPLLVINHQPLIIDLAVEVDSAGRFFVGEDSWTEQDYRFGDIKPKAQEEKNIEDLASKSQASFKYTVLNPDGAIWLLLSGGGASIVVADEGHNLGHGKEIANYGEYSGNPNTEETYLYTKNLLSMLVKSSAQKKVLIIAGGVANFTDVKKTFIGVMKAIEEVTDDLQKQGVKVYVRRGGPNQAEGLSMMTEFLKKHNLYGDVKGPELVLTDIVQEAIQE